MTLPNFLVIGAAKSGTTSLHYYLQQHPDVFLPALKENYFFAFEDQDVHHDGPGDRSSDRVTITRLEDYCALFSDANDEAALGEVCDGYLVVPGSAERIRRHVPDAKLIAILRQPVEGAYSMHRYLRRDGREPVADFEEAFRLGPERVKANWRYFWNYRGLGCYATLLEPYFALFDRQQIRVFLYEDLRGDPARVMRDTFTFIGVDPAFQPDVSRRHNPSGVPRSQMLHRLIKRPSRAKSVYRTLVPDALHRRIAPRLETANLKRDGLSPDLRKKLTSEYRDEILKLQDLIERDLSGWLK
jgi:hypothetical protein